MNGIFKDRLDALLNVNLGFWINADVAISNPGGGASKSLQLWIF